MTMTEHERDATLDDTAVAAVEAAAVVAVESDGKRARETEDDEAGAPKRPRVQGEYLTGAEDQHVPEVTAVKEVTPTPVTVPVTDLAVPASGPTTDTTDTSMAGAVAAGLEGASGSEQHGIEPPASIEPEKVLGQGAMDAPVDMDTHDDDRRGEGIVDVAVAVAVAATTDRGESPIKPKPEGKGKKAKHATSAAVAAGSIDKKKSAAAASKSSKVTKAASDKDKKKAKPKVKLEDVKSEVSSPTEDATTGNAAAALSTAGRVNNVPVVQGDAAEEDDTVYCICQGEFEEEDGTMIGCETCDNWFHPTCVGIREVDIDLLDVYICAACEEKTSRRTVYKIRCKRDECQGTTTGASKFCSPKCALQHAQSVIESLAMPKKKLNQLASTLAAYPAPTPPVNVQHHLVNPATDAPPPSSSSMVPQPPPAVLDSLTSAAHAVARALDLVEKRQRILAQAVQQCDELSTAAATTTTTVAATGATAAPNSGSSDSVPAVPDTGEAAAAAATETTAAAAPPPPPAPTKKSKSKRRDAGVVAPVVDDRPCAWQSRLMWDDDEVGLWNGERWEGEVCSSGRRCPRHQGWQRTTAVALDVEATQLMRRKDEISMRTEYIQRAQEVINAGRRARDEVHRLLSTV